MRLSSKIISASCLLLLLMISLKCS